MLLLIKIEEKANFIVDSGKMLPYVITTRRYLDFYFYSKLFSCLGPLT